MRYDDIRNRATPEQRAWMDREVHSRVFDKKGCGFSEMCPQCWRPIVWSQLTDTGGGVSVFTGKPGCQCGTIPSIIGSDFYLQIHGLEIMWPLVGGGGPGGRAD